MTIATRLLKLRSERANIDIPIRIFLPEDKDGTWYCRYEIDWPHGQWVHAAAGIDSVQSILLAFQMIGSEIYTSDYHKSGRLMFEAPGRGYGFPVASSLRDQLIGDDKKFY